MKSGAMLKTWWRFVFSRPSVPPFFRIYKPVLGVELLDRQIAVSHAYQFAYFRIYKAANSTVIATLLRCETGKQISHIAQMQRTRDQHYVRPSALTLKQARMLGHDYFKFTVVRNPYTRILSAYSDKILRNAANKREQVACALGLQSTDRVTFDDFLRYLEAGGINENGHWSRQVDAIPIPIEALDYIGRFEELGESIRFVCRKVFSQDNATIVSVREHCTAATLDNELLTEKAKSKIANLYADDFYAFKYSF